MTSQHGRKIITIHILPNISRSKSNQTMKIGQLMEYNIRNIFIAKSYAKCSGQISPRPFSKKSYLWINSLKFFAVCFVHLRRGLWKYIKTKVQTTYFYLI